MCLPALPKVILNIWTLEKQSNFLDFKIVNEAKELDDESRKHTFNLYVKSHSFYALASWLTLRPGSLGCIAQLRCVSHLKLGLEHIPALIDVQEQEHGESRFL